MKIAWHRSTGHGNDSKSPSVAYRKDPKRWWDSALVGIGMATLFVVLVLKLTDMLPKF